ncbi:cupin domain-containing protein [Bosea sp. MMO-172]|uniref:cupin domain-containing protein n=1 Tax=Bosea sp. MMO-172 TaxID=3127885 RepID=UPI00301AFBB3
MAKPSGDTLTPISALSWAALPGFPGLEVLTLSSNFDETRKTGRRTRLVRFAPGVETKEALTHDYFEEAMLIAGDLHGVREASAFGSFSEQAYVFRPPGTPHGPIRSEGGCVLLEVQYYAD